ncbi:MerR family transcriptional regulator [Paenibacillus larvae]|uniref:MerR family transcriptional regulator n=1 Tax=Paenibacillus larvae TaxID=1464 RepID=UPI0009AEB62D|nr:MerR family transcriptional regulator [Paenibacillus larvae]AQZ48418.1 MerR family transcriptional regulator [Paenibacillus larvae subsp. pulvifaciens]MBH0344809.1 MerR family transcriptional regulator [Paenibacillus larvae]MCY7520494.1 MerR family transcriptional regulator [Paenibacillus larvae]MCY9502555.1 MerR family transcriptional regulator [Paenibacillus larvae]MCY9510015.1 MerR family transcriptional regulator [Paenibacillus larvae]
MLYTVKEVAALSQVTVKTLHHYHKIELLLPYEISEAGYRLYGVKELERLQQILFYRELDFPLEKIKQLLEGESRLGILSDQKDLLLARKQRLDRLIQTLDQSIECVVKGEVMDQSSMFKGFESEQKWKNALAEHKEYLKETYGLDILEDRPIDVKDMNEKASRADRFMEEMAKALKAGMKFDDETVRGLIREHINFLNQNVHATSAEDFALQARFFLDDDFHRNIMESRQTGLAYYLFTAAESYAVK